MKERFVANAGKKIAKVGAGATVLAMTACGGKEATPLQSVEPTISVNNLSTVTPDFRSPALPSGITVTPEATATPTETKPAFQPGEKGLYESVDQMPVTDAQKERLKKILEGSNVQIVNNRSIVALENGIEDRVDCPVSAANPAGSRSACTSIDDVKLNIEGFPNAAETLDSMGPAVQKLVSERDGGVPIFKAYNADTGVIENIPVTKNAADVVWVYEIIKEPQKAGSKEKMMITQGAQGATYIYYPEGVVVVRSFDMDSIGNADVGAFPGTQNYQTIANLAIDTAHLALPGLLKQNLDGTAPYVITTGLLDESKKVTAPIVELVSPGRVTNSTNDSIVRSNGKFHYTMNDGRPVPRDNYLP